MSVTGFVIGSAALALTALLAGAPRAAEDDDPLTRKDLTAVIALQGLPCGQVVKSTRLGDNDFVAFCQDGNRYRVFVNAAGRVVVQKQ
jgi:hypothetical protein